MHFEINFYNRLLQVENMLDMLDPPFVDMMKVMIVCNKARISVGTDENARTLSISRVSPRRKQSIPTTAKLSIAFQFPPPSNLISEKGLTGPISSETGLHRRLRSIKVKMPSMRRIGEEEHITITGNPSETALLRYCSRIIAVRMEFKEAVSESPILLNKFLLIFTKPFSIILAGSTKKISFLQFSL